MAADYGKVKEFFTFRRIALPLILGLGAAAWLILSTYDPAVFKSIVWSWQTWFWLFLALVLMVIRDFAYIIRIRLLTDKKLSWRRSFITIMLWEFASSVTPSVVGGSAIALYIVNKEGISMGRTTAIVMITALLDELFFIIMVPIVFLTVGYNVVFTTRDFTLFGSEYSSQWVFLVGYLFIILLTSIILYGVFFNPRGFKFILLGIFKLPFLRKRRYKAINIGDDIIVTSSEMRSKPFSFWLKAFGATLLSWTARYWVVNCLIIAFMTVPDNMLLYARQLVMWVILLISPTPGGAGIAEFVFSDFLKDFITPGLGPALAVLWRLISFYPYIIIGVLIIPGWLKRVYSANKKQAINATLIK